MREDFEVRFMELMLERSTQFDTSKYPFVSDPVLEPWEAIECMNKTLNEFEATIYQP